MIRTDTTGFAKLGRDLAKLADVPVRQAMKQQIALTLKAAIQRVKTVSLVKAQKDVTRKIEAKFNTFKDGRAGTKNTVVAGQRFEGAKGNWPVVSIAPGQHRTWFGGPGKWRLVAGTGTLRKLSPAEWAEYQQQEGRRLSDKARAQQEVKAGVHRSHGLAKRAFYDAAEAIGVEKMMGSGVPAYAKKAIPASRRVYVNARGRDESSRGKTLFVTSITQPILAYKDMGARALQGAIGSRMKAFETDLTHGVFEDVKTMASRYPGVTLKM